MKKIILILITLFIVGCSNINSLSYDDILITFNEKSNKPNTFRTGYKYYLPVKMQVDSSILFSEVINDGNNKYYMYIDAVSYYNVVPIKYTSSNKAIYSKIINIDDKKGYLEINLYENNKYLVEIMYNYAKIEVMVDEKDLKKSMISAINILKSIEYNDNIIKNILGDDVLNFSQEEFDIFKTKTNEGNYIKDVEENDNDVDIVKDPDLIN